MKKLALILAILMMLTVALTACGKNAAETESTTPSTEDTTSAPDNTDDTEPPEVTEAPETDNGDENWSKDYPV